LAVRDATGGGEERSGQCRDKQKPTQFAHISIYLPMPGILDIESGDAPERAPRCFIKTTDLRVRSIAPWWRTAGRAVRVPIRLATLAQGRSGQVMGHPGALLGVDRQGSGWSSRSSKRRNL
jgi:hypothetical protein